MREERKFKASHFENIQELIVSCIIWIKTDDYDAYCRFFDMGAMEELIKELNNLKEIEKTHKEENGKLRVEFEKVYEDNLTLAKELEHEKEKNNELEIELSTRDNINVDKLVEKYKYYRRLADSYQANCISKDKLKELLENETIDISGFRCIAVEDIENLLEEK